MGKCIREGMKRRNVIVGFQSDMCVLSACAFQKIQLKECNNVNDNMVYSQTCYFYVHSTYVHRTTVQIYFEKKM